MDPSISSGIVVRGSGVAAVVVVLEVLKGAREVVTGGCVLPIKGVTGGCVLPTKGVTGGCALPIKGISNELGFGKEEVIGNVLIEDGKELALSVGNPSFDSYVVGIVVDGKTNVAVGFIFIGWLWYLLSIGKRGCGVAGLYIPYPCNPYEEYEE